MLNKQQAEKLLVPTIEGLGYEFVACDVVSSKSGKKVTNILRIYIDRTDQNNVTLDDCQIVNKHINKVLAVEFNDDMGSEFSSNYSVEVSSPGFDRPLVKLQHFARFIGSKVKVKLNMGFENVDTGVFQRNIVGYIKAVDDDSKQILITSLDDQQLVYNIDIDNINKANLVPQWDK